MAERRFAIPTAVVVGVLAAVASVWRITSVNSRALDTLVWAEDGLFPLCAKAHGVLPCLVDPYSGYFLLVPRLVAWPVSWFPLESWPLATNITAGVLVGVLVALAVLVLRAGGVGWVATVVVALMPVLVPIMGLEAINVAASVYMPLVFVAALALAFPPQGRFPTWPYAVGALVVALTMPSSALLLLPLVLQTWRGRIPVRGALITGLALAAGLAVQAWTAVTTEDPRRMAWSVDALRSWAETLPSAGLTFLPGQSRITATGSLSSDALTAWPWLGLLLALVLLVIGLLLAFSREGWTAGIGLLVITGLVMGAVPAAAGYANNRYFVFPVLLATAAIILAIDGALARWPVPRELVLAVVAGVAVLAWWPSMGASGLRTGAVPEWPEMLAGVRAACEADPDGSATFSFTPSWPFADARFPGPTNNLVPCHVLTN